MGTGPTLQREERHDMKTYNVTISFDWGLKFPQKLMYMLDATEAYEAKEKAIALAREAGYDDPILGTETQVFSGFPEPRPIDTGSLRRAIKSGQVDGIFRTKAAGTL